MSNLGFFLELINSLIEWFDTVLELNIDLNGFLALFKIYRPWLRMDFSDTGLAIIWTLLAAALWSGPVCLWVALGQSPRCGRHVCARSCWDWAHFPFHTGNSYDLPAQWWWYWQWHFLAVLAAAACGGGTKVLDAACWCIQFQPRPLRTGNCVSA